MREFILSTPGGIMVMFDSDISRRQLLAGATATAAGLLVGGRTGSAGASAPSSGPALVRAGRPRVTHGVQSGDVVGDRAIVWARADRASRMWVRVATTESGRDARWARGPVVDASSNFTGKVDLDGLRKGQRIAYQVRFSDLDDSTLVSEAVAGSFLTPPSSKRADVRFVWTGDCVGQGWGINPDFGGMRCFEAMRAVEPDFFVFSGDCIYADGPLKPEVTDAAGNVIWRNLVTPEKSKVCETLDEFRGAFLYNLLDDNMLRFVASTSMIAQWDDHEVANNWYPGEVLSYRPEYTIEQRIDVLSARARQAFHEIMPIRIQRTDPGRVYRKISYGPNVDVFVLDMRSYRAENSANLQTAPSAETAFLGAEQVAWLKRGLDESDATWKIIAADMPIGLWVTDYAPATNPHEPGVQYWEAIANGDNGVAKGRELEIADLLSFMKRREIRNVVWLTADVHYCAAHYYDPSKAASTDFNGFWEFVSGPVNAGTFGPNKLDATFGPQVIFQKAPPAGQANLPPSAGYQFFGQVDVDGHTKALTVKLIDLFGMVLFTQEIAFTE
jgi:alkaline phosphatase D